MDLIEAKRNLIRYEQEIEKLQGLSRGLMTKAEMITVDGMITKLKIWSKNLRVQLYEEQQKTRKHS